MREDQFYIAANFVRAAFKAYDNGSEEVRDRILNLFLKEFLSQSNAVLDNKRRYELENGRKSPAFLVISPGGTCNLRCKDCYASSIPKGLPSLPFETVDRILTEKYEKWGSWFTVVSGGEPFLWKDGDKGIIDIARLHPEQYFLIYTNGTFIDKKLQRNLRGLEILRQQFLLKDLKRKQMTVEVMVFIRKFLLRLNIYEMQVFPLVYRLQLQIKMQS